MEKQLGWACKLGGAESLYMSKVGQTVLATLMESQIWHQLARSMALWGEGPEKGQWPLLALMPDSSALPLHTTGVPQAASPAPEPRESEFEKVSLCVGFLRGTAWGSRSFFH